MLASMPDGTTLAARGLFARLAAGVNGHVDMPPPARPGLVTPGEREWFRLRRPSSQSAPKTMRYAAFLMQDAELRPTARR